MKVIGYYSNYICILNLYWNIEEYLVKNNINFGKKVFKAYDFENQVENTITIYSYINSIGKKYIIYINDGGKSKYKDVKCEITKLLITIDDDEKPTYENIKEFAENFKEEDLYNLSF